jgi:hypothetical protein
MHVICRERASFIACRPTAAGSVEVITAVIGRQTLVASGRALATRVCANGHVARSDKSGAHSCKSLASEGESRMDQVESGTARRKRFTMAARNARVPACGPVIHMLGAAGAV